MKTGDKVKYIGPEPPDDNEAEVVSVYDSLGYAKVRWPDGSRWNVWLKDIQKV